MSDYVDIQKSTEADVPALFIVAPSKYLSTKSGVFLRAKKLVRVTLTGEVPVDEAQRKGLTFTLASNSQYVGGLI